MRLSLQLSPSDTFFEIGCGDGRVCLAVHERFQCRCVGMDNSEELIAKCHSALFDMNNASAETTGATNHSTSTAEGKQNESAAPQPSPITSQPPLQSQSQPQSQPDHGQPVEFFVGDIRDQDTLRTYVAAASAVYLFMLPSANRYLEPVSDCLSVTAGLFLHGYMFMMYRHVYAHWTLLSILPHAPALLPLLPLFHPFPSSSSFFCMYAPPSCNNNAPC